MALQILDVGQCGFDGPRMAELWANALDATVDSVDTSDEAVERVNHKKYDLVLVNRVLAADDSSGLDAIKALLDTATPPRVMLVSDRPDAQEKAVALGAVRGFGKADLEAQRTIDLVKRAASGS